MIGATVSGLEWQQANGALCDMVCRGLLLMLQRGRRDRAARRCARYRSIPWSSGRDPRRCPSIRRRLTGALRELKPIACQQARRTAHEPLFNNLIEQHHYLG